MARSGHIHFPAEKGAKGIAELITAVEDSPAIRAGSWHARSAGPKSVQHESITR
jgi:hypothetical protein